MKAISIEQTPRAALSALRERVEHAQGRRLDAPVLPVVPALSGVLPGGGLRPGTAYALESSAALTLALLAGPSQAGSWCAAIGMPELGAEAGEQAGVALERLVLIPDPGSRWLAVVATAAEVMPVIAVRPPSRAGSAEVARLGARLRDRGAVLLVQGSWPQAEASLSLREPAWNGLERGHGALTGREVTVVSASRRWPLPRTTRIALPDARGRVAESPAQEHGVATPLRALAPQPERRAG